MKNAQNKDDWRLKIKSVDSGCVRIFQHLIQYKNVRSCVRYWEDILWTSCRDGPCQLDKVFRKAL